jgi:ABC-2 type transport system permease protein
MVRILIAMRRTIVEHQLARTSKAALLAGTALVFASALGTLWLGLVSYPDPAAASGVLALVFMLWLGGRVAQSALAGEPVLRPELFSLLPLSRRQLAYSLLIVGAADPAGLFIAVAFAALIARGARLGIGPALIGLAAVVLTLALASVASTAAAAALGPGSRRGHDAGTIVTAVALSALAVAGTLLPVLIAALRRDSGAWPEIVLRALPTAWGPQAVAAAARGDWPATCGYLAGLVLVTAALALWWPAILGRRMDGAAQPARRGSSRHAGRPLLPQTPVGAVAAKELRLWMRDPVRLTCLLIAVLVGAAACAIPRVTGGTNVMLPFAGLLTAIIAGACACNLYGNDGTGFWLTVMTPHAARSDVRGRQLAWLIVVAPYTIVITIAFTALSGQHAAWLWAPALLLAVLGGAAGLIPLASLISVQPLDATGNPTPAWSLKVHVALLAVTFTALAPAAVILAGWLWHARWLSWAALPVGLASGLALLAWLGRRARTRLDRDQVRVLRVLADAAR